jgi:hypothetical protein
LRRFCAAVTHTAFHQGEAFGWWGRLSQRTSALVWSMLSVSDAAAASILSTEGVSWSGGRCDLLLKVWIYSSCFLGSIRNPRLVSMMGGAVATQVQPVMCSIAWSDPRLLAQSMCRSEKVAAQMAALLYHARSITESLSWSAPFLVISPGLFTNVSRFVAAHSSMRLAHCNWGMSGGDHVGECALKLPIISIGVIASMLRFSSICRLVLSHTLW